MAATTTAAAATTTTAVNSSIGEGPGDKYDTLPALPGYAEPLDFLQMSGIRLYDHTERVVELPSNEIDSEAMNFAALCTNTQYDLYDRQDSMYAQLKAVGAISGKTAEPLAAWAFMRYFLTPSFNRNRACLPLCSKIRMLLRLPSSSDTAMWTP